MGKAKTIQNLNVEKINASHLITLKKGFMMYRRTRGNPLEFHYNDTTFTTEVLPENRNLDIIATNSGSSSMINTVKGTFTETKWDGKGKLYRIKVTESIDRIVDLDIVCAEQNIERQYLHIYNTYDGRDREKEKELFNLYSKEIQEKRIHGVKYSSRRSLGDTCYIFYDTLVDLNNYLSYEEIPD